MARHLDLLDHFSNQFPVFGGLSPVIMANKIPLMGIFERIPIAIYFGWLILFYRKFYITFCDQ
jgi:hypothetical protein